MDFSYFIARKVALSNKKSFSRLIIRIATVAVALSVAIMIITTAVVRGFKNQISDKIFGLWGQIHITDAAMSRSMEESTPVKMDQKFYPSLDTLRQITTLVPNKNIFTKNANPFVSKTSNGGVRHIQVYALKPGIIKTKEEIEGIMLKGAGRDFDWEFMKKSLVEGRPIQFNDSVPSREVIISQFTANRLKVKLNDKFIIHFLNKGEQLKRAFTICGIYKTGLEEYDKKIAFADIGIVQDLLGWKRTEVAGFEVFVEDYADIEELADYIHTESLPNYLSAQTIRDKFPSIFEWLDLQDMNEMIIIVLMALVALINMITALLILILERTEMIGILKSFGANHWAIRKIFLYHAAWIVGVGLFFGNLFGITVCFLQEKFKIIKLPEADYYLSYAPVELHFPTILMLNVLTLLIVLLFLIIPTYLITRISPVQAIRLK
jgi:lipoprotein-releasing system permease protein